MDCFDAQGGEAHIRERDFLDHFLDSAGTENDMCHSQNLRAVLNAILRQIGLPIGGSNLSALVFSSSETETMMRKDKVHDEASQTEAVEGTVVVDGPDSVAVLLTPDAAEATADRLKETAGDARDQVKPD